MISNLNEIKRKNKQKKTKVICPLGMDYKSICERVLNNGEPGFFFLENAQKYGRMGDPPVLFFFSEKFVHYLITKNF